MSITGVCREAVAEASLQEGVRCPAALRSASGVEANEPRTGGERKMRPPHTLLPFTLASSVAITAARLPQPIEVAGYHFPRPV